jgi:hypothetical protein
VRVLVEHLEGDGTVILACAKAAKGSSVMDRMIE